MPTDTAALAAEPTPLPPSKKWAGPPKKDCYGTFRDEFAEEKKEECHTCWMYVDCIQVAFKARRQFRQEVARLVGLLRMREAALAAGVESRTRSGRLIVRLSASGRYQALSA